jgi:mono/diheme cytochrome c family protein
MKTILAMVTKILFAAVLFLFISQISYAQAKPKGQPWSAPASAISMKNPTMKADALSIKDGKELYNKNCKSCHGDLGKGDGTKSRNLDISCGDFTLPEFKKETDGEIFWKISEGRKPMPSFGKKLTDAERWSVVNYIRTLNK